MAKFLSELNICPHPDTDSLWILQDILGYESDVLGGQIWVPKWFCCDMASTDHIPLVTFIWGNCAHREGVLHDYLYCKDSDPIVTKAMADEIFLEAMKCRGKSAFVYYPLYWGVRIGGFPFYHKKSVELCGVRNV